MPFLAGPETLDTTSQDGNCIYPPTPLGGAPTPSTVVIGGAPLQFYHSLTFVSLVSGVKINPVIPAPCQIGTRIIEPKVNKTVLINGKLPAVSGDSASLPFGSLRPLTAPFQHPTIVIGSNL